MNSPCQYFYHSHPFYISGRQVLIDRREPKVVYQLPSDVFRWEMHQEFLWWLHYRNWVNVSISHQRPSSKVLLKALLTISSYQWLMTKSIWLFWYFVIYSGFNCCLELDRSWNVEVWPSHLNSTFVMNFLLWSLTPNTTNIWLQKAQILFMPYESFVKYCMLYFRNFLFFHGCGFYNRIFCGFGFS